MRVLVAMIAVLMLPLVCLAQCSSGSCGSSSSGGFSMGRGSMMSMGSPMYMSGMSGSHMMGVLPRVSVLPRPTASDLDQEELSLMRSSLTNMDEALALQAKTGKPVLCWMDEDGRPFRDPKAREVARIVQSKSIMVAMRTDGVLADKHGNSFRDIGPRVKVSNGGYAEGSRTAYVPVSKFSTATPQKLLAYAAAGK